MAKPTLERFSALVGPDVAIGYMRDDSFIAHVIMKCKPGDAFEVKTHFESCPICRAHGITEDDFSAYMRTMVEKRIHGSEKAGAGDLGQIDEVLTGEVVGACPSCHAALSIGSGVDPKTGKPASSLLHPMPFCSYFGETEPEAILKAIGIGQ